MPDRGGGPIVLDTHVWIWLVSGESARISKRAVDAIEEESRRGGLRVSAISVWEVAMLEAKGRLGLALPVQEWVRAALRAPGVRLLELTPEIAVESTRLPGDTRGDPADRILVASARATGARLATRDGRILDYAADGHVRVLDATP